ncbi:PREDICTED: uncharacterized protein LOC108780525 [Cyphomyrmex costatus]|uniref:uncharacterized protein LOC108780525 n=1 Tax=Cyphomyrmex costatus TaxID=456900 RepID=UPI0008522D7C|nr:PREDICTED: uncharacterized protein LOC108780525 [Cyphomyrmex costatus]
MKVPISIQIPSTSTESAAIDDESNTNFPFESVWSIDLTESIAVSEISSPVHSQYSSSSSSSMLINKTIETNPIQSVPFSPSATKEINSKDRISTSESFGTSTITKKFKSKANTEIVVPPCDNFAKRKKNNMDGFLGQAVQMMDKMANTVENVVSHKQIKPSLPKNIAFESLSATIATIMEDVPKEKRTKCLIKVLQVIEEFID